MSKHEWHQHGCGLLLEAHAYKVQMLFQGLGKDYFKVKEAEKEGQDLHLHDALQKVGAFLGGNREPAIAADKDCTPLHCSG